MVDILAKFNLPDFILIFLLITSAYTDFRYRKVYNIITFPVILSGVCVNAILFGTAGLKESITGLAAGTAFFLFFFIIGIIGAGDIKYMAAIGSLKGWKFTVIGGLYGAGVGAVIAVVAILMNRKLLIRLKNALNSMITMFNFKIVMLPDRKNAHYLPYASILSLGFAIYLIEELLKK